jgi:Flp pilus assembly protein TadD
MAAPMQHRIGLLASGALALSLLSVGGGAASAASPVPVAKGNELGVTGVASEPEHRAKPSATELSALRDAVAKDPRMRHPRLALVRALMTAGDLEGARTEAKAWREHDAYNLVAVRLLGDIETELGNTPAARRTYSSIVELLPKDVEARRALATVLKQGGDLEGSRRELTTVLELRPEDRRVAFELGDVEQRLGRVDDARKRFESTAEAGDADEALRYPAKQRLAQIHQKSRRAALDAEDQEGAAREAKAIEALGIQGGIENDVKIFLSWDTDRTDVDLWVTTPRGEKVFYSHPSGAAGEKLFHDVTTGYGPESFTVHAATRGDYVVQVNYYGVRQGDFKEARGEVVVVLDEGRPTERTQTFPYRLFERGEVVTVARIHSAVQQGGAS